MSSGRYSLFILPDASRTKSTFGGTDVAAELEIGALPMSVSAAIADGGAATEAASAAHATNRFARPRVALRSKERDFMSDLLETPSFGSIHHGLHEADRVLRAVDPGRDAVVDLAGTGQRLRAGFFGAALAGIGDRDALLADQIHGAGLQAHAMDHVAHRVAGGIGPHGLDDERGARARAGRALGPGRRGERPEAGLPRLAVTRSCDRAR